MSQPQRTHVGPVDAPHRYELVQRFAVGGEGEVWKAYEYHAGEPFAYAVKIISVDDNERPEERLEDLRMQAALATHLEHPSVVKVKEVFVGPPPPGSHTTDPRLYFVMKWIEGQSLQDALERRELKGLGILKALAPIAEAIDYLHSGRDTNGSSVIHRDIKPANILIASDGRVYLVDFGLVRLRATETTSRIFGTAPFMAPESLSHGEYTPATDRYTLGATAYYAITGEMPVPGVSERMMQQLISALGPGNDRLARGIIAMLAPQPERRPASAAAWIRALISPPPPATSKATIPRGGPAGTPSDRPYLSQLPPTGMVSSYPPGRAGPASGVPYPTSGASTPAPGPVSAVPVAAYSPPPPSSPYLGAAASGYYVGPQQPVKKKRSIGNIIGLSISGLVLLLVVVCCASSAIEYINEKAGDAQDSATPSRSIDRSVPPPAATALEPVLVSVADIVAVMRVQQKAISAGSLEDMHSGVYPDVVGSGLTRMALCAEKPVNGDAIGANTSNLFDVDGANYTSSNVSSAVAGFYGGYAAEYFTAAREQALRCGWQQFSVPTIAEESFGAFTTCSRTKEPVALLFVRSGQVLFRLVVQAEARGAYQTETIKLAQRMATRIPKATP
ncbi:MAG: protein kinase [Dactylosporangium sp.]|nr:protein kinase [Dactylosporangium sp.]NNJ61191.1 protein kinase [Dactylosporangium sp.]